MTCSFLFFSWPKPTLLDRGANLQSIFPVLDGLCFFLSFSVILNLFHLFFFFFFFFSRELGHKSPASREPSRGRIKPLGLKEQNHPNRGLHCLVSFLLLSLSLLYLPCYFCLSVFLFITPDFPRPSLTTSRSLSYVDDFPWTTIHPSFITIHFPLPAVSSSLLSHLLANRAYDCLTKTSFAALCQSGYLTAPETPG